MKPEPEPTREEAAAADAGGPTDNPRDPQTTANPSESNPRETHRENPRTSAKGGKGLAEGRAGPQKPTKGKLQKPGKGNVSSVLGGKREVLYGGGVPQRTVIGRQGELARPLRAGGTVKNLKEVGEVVGKNRGYEKNVFAFDDRADIERLAQSRLLSYQPRGARPRLGARWLPARSHFLEVSALDLPPSTTKTVLQRRSSVPVPSRRRSSDSRAESPRVRIITPWEKSLREPLDTPRRAAETRHAFLPSDFSNKSADRKSAIVAPASEGEVPHRAAAGLGRSGGGANSEAAVGENVLVRSDFSHGEKSLREPRGRNSPITPWEKSLREVAITPRRASVGGDGSHEAQRVVAAAERGVVAGGFVAKFPSQEVSSQRSVLSSRNSPGLREGENLLVLSDEAFLELQSDRRSETAGWSFVAGAIFGRILNQTHFEELFPKSEEIEQQGGAVEELSPKNEEIEQQGGAVEEFSPKNSTQQEGGAVEELSPKNSTQQEGGAVEELSPVPGADNRAPVPRVEIPGGLVPFASFLHGFIDPFVPTITDAVMLQFVWEACYSSGGNAELVEGGGLGAMSRGV